MKYCTAVNCMDGRVQVPVIEYLTYNHGYQFVDMITEPGPVKHITSKKKTHTKKSILSRIVLSRDRHASDFIALIAHYDCAGNPVTDEIQISQLYESKKIITELFPSSIILPLWIDDQMQVHKI